LELCSYGAGTSTLLLFKIINFFLAISAFGIRVYLS